MRQTSRVVAIGLVGGERLERLVGLPALDADHWETKLVQPVKQDRRHSPRLEYNPTATRRFRQFAGDRLRRRRRLALANDRPFTVKNANMRLVHRDIEASCRGIVVFVGRGRYGFPEGRPVLLSYKHQFVFVHIPKTAGMSVHRALAKAAPDAIRRIDDMPAFSDPEKQRHVPAKDLRDYVGEANWIRLFSFAFVRNPFARLVSWYNMCHERPSNKFMWFVKENLTFHNSIVNDSDILHRTRINQIDYVTDGNGVSIVNFVGRYEQLEHDFNDISKKLGFSTFLPHINTTKRVDYRTYYDNDRLGRNAALLVD